MMVNEDKPTSAASTDHNDTSRKYRIAMFIGVFPTPSETFIVNQIVALKKAGHQVDIFSMGRPSSSAVHSDVEKYRLVDQCVYLVTPEMGALAKLAEVARTFAGSSQWVSVAGVVRLMRVARRIKGWSYMSIFRIVARQLMTGPYDLVHCQFGDLGQSVEPLISAQVLHGKLVTAIRGHDVTQVQRFDREFYRELAARGDYFMPVSESMRQRLLELGFPDEKIGIVRSGIDCKKLKFAQRAIAPNGVMKLISVGRLVEMKGTQYAVRAAAQLAAAGVPFTYEIIGSGPLQESLQALIDELGLEHQVKLLGLLSHDQVISRIAEADIMLMPSVTAENGEQEGLPNALKEALACGLLVVATRHSGVPELIEHGVCGYLSDEKDVEAMVNNLLALQRSPEVWGKFSEHGRWRVETEYDLPVVHEQLLRCYARVCR